ncbi:MAG: hypothetical protein WC413_00365 [Candidatus Nanoarchaeia archaeon]
MKEKFILSILVFYVLILYPYWLLYNLVGFPYYFFISLIGFIIFVKLL